MQKDNDTSKLLEILANHSQPMMVSKPTIRQFQNGRHHDVNALPVDLQNSDIITDDVNTAFNQYNSTLIDLLDKHARLRLQRISSCHSDRCYDSE